VNRILNQRPGERAESGLAGTAPRNDPVRVVVQAALALYLLPVLLIVLLVGGGAMVAGGVGRVLRRVGRVLSGPGVADPGRFPKGRRATAVPHRPQRVAYRLKNRSA
jgi:hypothetical protein